MYTVRLILDVESLFASCVTYMQSSHRAKGAHSSRTPSNGMIDEVTCDRVSRHKSRPTDTCFFPYALILILSLYEPCPAPTLVARRRKLFLHGSNTQSRKSISKGDAPWVRLCLIGEKLLTRTLARHAEPVRGVRSTSSIIADFSSFRRLHRYTWSPAEFEKACRSDRRASRVAITMESLR